MPARNEPNNPRGGGPPVADEFFKPASETPNAVEAVIIALSYLLIAVTLPFSIWICFRPIQEYQRAVVLRLGRLRERKAIGPGLVSFIPCTDDFYVVDMRVKSFDIEPQEILTKGIIKLFRHTLHGT